MKTAGVICEYNPFHLGHAEHIESTRKALGGDAGIICIMSGNFVQRGDFAIFNKHARAKMAVLSGADLVIELPVPYALSSAGGFAKAGVCILDKLGVCDYISFGSESGNIGLLHDAARGIGSVEAQRLIREWLGRGLPYASAQQKAANVLLGAHAEVFSFPNNSLGIEYIKAIEELSSPMRPMTIRRIGGEHDGETGYSASALRKILLRGNMPLELMSGEAAAVCMEEIVSGRGPVSMYSAEQAVLSRLRFIDDYGVIPGASEGLDRRFKRYANSETSIAEVLTKVKTKRYAMSRLRRMLMCAVLGITTEDANTPPPYIRVLAMSSKGMELLRKAQKKARLPVIIKPASVQKLGKSAQRLFNLEVTATDFYVLAYDKQEERIGGSEWRQSPIVIE